MKTDRYFFQNPNDGYPMVLVQRGALVLPVVTVCEGDDDFQPAASTFNDAVKMTHAIKTEKLSDIDSAARFLKREFGTADILD